MPATTTAMTEILDCTSTLCIYLFIFETLPLEIKQKQKAPRLTWWHRLALTWEVEGRSGVQSQVYYTWISKPA